MFLTRKLVWIFLLLGAVVMFTGACTQPVRPQQSLDSEEFKRKISEYLKG